ncbi:MAG: hypothetical protein IT364_04105 [Candidatus Hydrogenedentes bacterium]|nr:hypothetical protein [Candidatus Hydrogenedentota bacterium]
MELERLLGRIRESITQGKFQNEAAISQGVILPILQCLGWPVFDTQIVSPEFRVEGTRVDFALCRGENRPLVFLEAKRIGNAEGGDRQLFEYAYHAGVQFVVLTDGQEWHLYLPAEQGSYLERRVYKLDLLERELEECVYRLKRYLSYAEVCSGIALENARQDHRDVSRQRAIVETLPEAWHRLLEKPDDLLLELLADKVEDICGFKPDLEDTAEFIAQLPFHPGVQADTRPPAEAPSQASYRHLDPQPPAGLHGRRGFRLYEQRRDCNAAIEIVAEVLKELQRRDHSFLERFSARRHGRTRQLISRDRQRLYPGRADLCESYAKELVPGWWIGTNYSVSSMKTLLRLACEIANIRYGTDLVIEW